MIFLQERNKVHIKKQFPPYYYETFGDMNSEKDRVEKLSQLLSYLVN